MRDHPSYVGKAGFTLTELLIAVAIAGTLTAVGLTGFHSLRQTSRLHAAVRSVRGHLTLARTLALGRREQIRVRLDSSSDLVILDPVGNRLASASVGRGDDLPVDSVRIRPATMRFNARGQAAPGSVYLHLGDRTVRVVCNFLGRLRVESSRRR